MSQLILLQSVAKAPELVLRQVQDLQTTHAVKDLWRQILQLVTRHVQDAVLTQGEATKGLRMQLRQVIVL